MKTTPSGLFAMAAVTAAALLLSACGTTRLPEDQRTAAPVETRSPVATSTTTRAPGVAATPTPLAQSSVATVDLAAAPPSARSGTAAATAGGGTVGAGAAALLALPSQNVVYFDFDSYVIKDDFKPVLDGYARVLSANRSKRLTIEGHTDERGGREYNLALGQKRAAAVLGSLKLLGVDESQMEAVSFGEERAAVAGSDEAAWAKNRRAELKGR